MGSMKRFLTLLSTSLVAVLLVPTIALAAKPAGKGSQPSQKTP
jgi:hypothetical protein